MIRVILVLVMFLSGCPTINSLPQGPIKSENGEEVMAPWGSTLRCLRDPTLVECSK